MNEARPEITVYMYNYDCDFMLVDSKSEYAHSYSGSRQAAQLLQDINVLLSCEDESCEDWDNNEYNEIDEFLQSEGLTSLTLEETAVHLLKRSVYKIKLDE